ncbi:uncharacterized protein Dana_GF22407 [Drosophila ananassae]|uniref:Uncharacterized protein n=1 Tax=Drosophila ananassae TaxID=7217 RepID=B3MWQ2_DROAN|nr:cyclin-dependent kinase 12 [Drosophila ananassae]EDV35037.1 uncharacterized protein Dana_GF22407 [Drosophila ananassae]
MSKYFNSEILSSLLAQAPIDESDPASNRFADLKSSGRYLLYVSSDPGRQIIPRDVKSTLRTLFREECKPKNCIVRIILTEEDRISRAKAAANLKVRQRVWEGVESVEELKQIGCDSDMLDRARGGRSLTYDPNFSLQVEEIGEPILDPKCNVKKRVAKCLPECGPKLEPVWPELEAVFRPEFKKVDPDYDPECDLKPDPECDPQPDTRRDASRDASRDSKRDTKPDTSGDPQCDPRREPRRDASRDPRCDSTGGPKCDSAQDPRLDVLRDLKRDASRDSKCESARDPKLDASRVASREPKLDVSRDSKRVASRDTKRDDSRVASRDPQRDVLRDPRLDVSRDPKLTASRDSKRVASRNPNLDASRDARLDASREPQRVASRDLKHDASRDPQLNDESNPVMVLHWNPKSVYSSRSSVATEVAASNTKTVQNTEASGSPDKTSDSPDKTPDSPDKTSDSPDKTPDSPDKTPDSPDKTPDSPVKTDGKTSKTKSNKPRSIRDMTSRTRSSRSKSIKARTPKAKTSNSDQTPEQSQPKGSNTDEIPAPSQPRGCETHELPTFGSREELMQYIQEVSAVYSRLQKQEPHTYRPEEDPKLAWLFELSWQLSNEPLAREKTLGSLEQIKSGFSNFLQYIKQKFQASDMEEQAAEDKPVPRTAEECIDPNFSGPVILGPSIDEPLVFLADRLMVGFNMLFNRCAATFEPVLSTPEVTVPRAPRSPSSPAPPPPPSSSAPAPPPPSRPSRRATSGSYQRRATIREVIGEVELPPDTTSDEEKPNTNDLRGRVTTNSGMPVSGGSQNRDGTLPKLNRNK